VLNPTHSRFTLCLTLIHTHSFLWPVCGTAWASWYQRQTIVDFAAVRDGGSGCSAAITAGAAVKRANLQSRHRH